MTAPAPTSTNTDRAGVTAEFARFVLDTTDAEFDDETRRAVRRSILDSLGVMIAGARHEAVNILLDTLRELGTGTSTLVGRRERTDPITATLANGVMAHVLDWDDTILPTRLHPSCTLVPALLAIGERTDATVADLGPPLAIGFELQQRLAMAAYPDYAERGWHGTGVVGGVGVAAAAGRLLGLDPGRMAHAFALAATGGAGITAVFGSMAKALNLGRAAASGIQSVLLAERGFTGITDVLDPGRGWLAQYAAQPATEALLEGLGRDWAIRRNGFKPYPCGVVAHAAIDAVLELRAASGGAVLTSLDLVVSPEAMRLMGNPQPRTGLEAKFSVRYAAAAAWTNGEVSPGSFTDAAVGHSGVRAVMERITVRGSGEVAQEAAVANAKTNEQTLQVTVAHAQGTLERPMTDEELMDKFTRACEIGGNPNADRIAAHLDDGAAPVASLTELLRP